MAAAHIHIRKSLRTKWFAYEDVFDGGVLDIYIASAEVDSESAPGAVWIHTDEGGDLEQLVLILQHAMDTLPEITSAQGFQWAITCSKPRVDEFGGGACFMVRGKPTEWMQTSGWLAMMIEES